MNSQINDDPTATVALQDLAAVIRSKNAGPYELTFDVMFTDIDTYAHVRDTRVLERQRLAELFRVPDQDIIYCDWLEPALAFKLTLIRWGNQGGVGERDTFGAQQHAPLLNIRVPSPPGAVDTRSIPDHAAPALPPTATRVRDPQQFRRVLGQYPTGVTVVTAIGPDGRPEGMVVGSFTSVSLDPPLVAFLPSTGSRSWATLRKAGRFCVNILGADQEHLCRQFSSRTEDKYDGVAWRPGPSGSPVLDSAVAWIDCETETIHTAGDHDIVIGRVIDLDTAAENDPLLFFRGGYGSFIPRTMVASDDRLADELNLVDRARHLLEGTARSLRCQVAVAHCDGQALTMLATSGHHSDHRLPRAALGERVALAAPIGIWWMSHAASDVVDAWVAPLEKPQQDRIREALRLIRSDDGVTVGLAAVHDGFGDLLVERAAGTRQSPAEEADLVSTLALDPSSFVASRFGATETSADHPEVRSLWSPVLDRNGRAVLGVMVTGFPSDVPLVDVVRAVGHLASEMELLTNAGRNDGLETSSDDHQKNPSASTRTEGES